MRIMMLQTHCACEDGKTVRWLEEGKIYEVADFVARMFIRRGAALCIGE